jgi:hypothetical protein
MKVRPDFFSRSWVASTIRWRSKSSSAPSRCLAALISSVGSGVFIRFQELLWGADGGGFVTAFTADSIDEMLGCRVHYMSEVPCNQIIGSVYRCDGNMGRVSRFGGWNCPIGNQSAGQSFSFKIGCKEFNIGQKRRSLSAGRGVPCSALCDHEVGRKETVAKRGCFPPFAACCLPR